MGTTKRVEVIIDGQEFVSKAAKEAGDGVEGFFTRAKNWTKGFADLKAGWDMVSGAATKVWGVIQDSFAAYDEYSASQTRMAGQAKITGISLDTLKAAAKTAREEFGLGVGTANDAAVATAKYASRAGDASLQSKLMAAALDLGAASGLSAAEAMEALELGLKGQDEGFNKLGLSDPSKLWKDYADANGLAAGKMTETQKRMAELTAIVDAGSKVQGASTERLGTAAGQQQLLNNKVQDAQVALGQMLEPLRKLTIEMLGGFAGGLGDAAAAGQGFANTARTIAETLGPVLGPAFRVAGATVIAFGVGLERIMISIKNLGYNAELMVGSMLSSFGQLVQKGGNMLKLFGIDVVEGMGKSMYIAGDTMRQEAAISLAAVGRELQDWQRRTWEIGQMFAGRRVATAEKEAEGVVDAAEKGGEKVVDAVTKTAVRSETVSVQSLRALGNIVGITTTAIEDLNSAASAQLPPEQAKKFADEMERAADNARTLAERIQDTADRSLAEAQRKAKEMADNVVDIARTALDAAQAFGIVDDKAASALNSVINIGASIAKMTSGDVAGGLTGMVAGIANIVTMMVGSDPERRRLLRENNTQLSRLRDEIGNLSLSVTGDDFNKVTNALQAIVPNLRGSNYLVNLPTIVDGLAKAGVSFDKLDEVAKALGIQIRDKDGNLRVDMLRSLLEGIGLAEFGRFGTDYSSQLRATEAGFDVNGTSATGQIAALGALGAGLSDALKGVVDVSDIAGSRSRLAGLFTRLNAGGVSAEEMGGLTGSQFLDLLMNLIGRIDGLGDGATAAPTAGGTTSSDSATVNVPGIGSVSTSVAADIPAAVQAQTDSLTPMLQEANGYHRRTADAVEEAVHVLQRIDGRLAGFSWFQFVDDVDISLAQRRTIARSASGNRF